MVQEPSWRKWLRIREARIQIDAIEGTRVLPVKSPIAEIRPSSGKLKATQLLEVVLRIPIEIPPDAVADLYRSLRDEAISSIDVPLIKNTPISEKTLTATVFAVERSQTGDAWGDVFDEWMKYARSKRKGKEWGYASTQSFIAAVHKTYKRLTGRKLQWKRKRGERKKQFRIAFEQIARSCR
jgi:hypothetical protein